MKQRIVLIDWTKEYIATVSAMNDAEIVLAVTSDRNDIKECQDYLGQKDIPFYIRQYDTEAEYTECHRSNYNLTYEDIRNYAATQLKIEHFMHRELDDGACIQYRYLVALRYFLGFFEHEKVDMVFSSEQEHGGVFDTLIFDIAEKKNIPVYVVGLSSSNGKHRITSIRDRNEGTLCDLSDLQKSPIDTGTFFNAMDRFNERTYRIKSSSGMYATFKYWKSVVRGTLCSTKDIITGSYQVKMYEKFSYSGVIERKERYDGYAYIYRLRRFYEKLACKADYERPYIYYPLHQEPEASVMVQAPLSSQLEIVRLLAENLPSGWLLYVKEHPSTFNVYERARYFYKNIRYFRHPRFYTNVIQHKNVRLIGVREPTCELIRHSQAVASICGTALSEAILQGKPIIVFGRGISWYEHLKAAYAVDSVNCLKYAMQQLKSKKPDYSDQEDMMNQFAVELPAPHVDRTISPYSEQRAQIIRYLLNYGKR